MEGSIYRGELFYMVDSPLENTSNSYRHFIDGGLVVVDGRVKDTGDYNSMKSLYPEFPVVDYTGKLLMPGFIDTHNHFPQYEILGMYGKQLLDWLDEYTFPAERGFISEEHSSHIANLFLMELLRNGTTCSCSYCTIHSSSVNALFTAASKYNMTMLAGKVMMDRNSPDFLQDNVIDGYNDCRELIENWDGKGRNHYVVTPRFAITSTVDQLNIAGRLHAEYPNTYVQTHLSENRSEIESVLSLFPDSNDYLEVYERAGLLTGKTIFGHCVHLTEREYGRLAESGAVVAHCPTSNLFLGSGLYDMDRANHSGIKTTLATDVGAGTSFSMLRTMGEAYKVQQLRGYSLSPLESLYNCTLGAARSLGLDGDIGTLLPGRAADFIVVDYVVGQVQQSRMEYLISKDKWTLENRLFGLQVLGDDRNIVSTYVMGRCVSQAI